MTRACAIERRHCAPRLTFTRRTRRYLLVDATQQKRCRRMLRRTATASAANGFSRNLRLSDYVMRTRPRQIKARTSERTIMETPAKREPTASDEIVKLIRKLRWVGWDD